MLNVRSAREQEKWKRTNRGIKMMGPIDYSLGTSINDTKESRKQKMASEMYDALKAIVTSCFSYSSNMVLWDRIEEKDVIKAKEIIEKIDGYQKT